SLKPSSCNLVLTTGPFTPCGTWESGRGAKKRAGLDFNVRLRERGEWKMRICRFSLCFSSRRGLVYPSLFSTSSLGIVPRPLPQRATTTLTNYPNFLIQATFNIDRTTLETVESSAEA